MRRISRVIVFAAVALGLAACGSSPKERFYTLSETASGQPQLPSQDYSVVVGPVTMPDIVDRPQLVLRMSESEVKVAEQALWAEPLKSAIARAVAQNVAHDLNNARVSPYPQGPGGGEPDYRVALDVQRFDSVLGQAATIEVIWTLRRTKTGEQQTGRVRLKELVSGQSYQDLVSAHVRALNEFSRNIAAVIQTSQQNPLAATQAPQSGVGKTQ